MTIPVTDHLRLQLLEPSHADEVYAIAEESRKQLQPWLPWVVHMKDKSFIENFIQGSMDRHRQGIEWGFVIVQGEDVVGRIGVYKIDDQNKIGEIGYWIGTGRSGKGIVSQSCRKLVEFCFGELGLNRLEIKCATQNTPSIRIPEALGFTKEGVLRQAEQLHGSFVDLALYALCKSDINP